MNRLGDHVWLDGRLVPWNDATVHVFTHALHYGTAVFEGIRGYQTAAGLALFRLDAHLRRLEESARLYRMPLPYDSGQLREAIHELVRANRLDECYVRPLAFRGLGSVGLDPRDNPVQVAIGAWHFGGYLEESRQTGARAMVSSWRRLPASAFAPQAKAAGHYLNSVLAKVEAADAGYDVALLLDEFGNLSEGTAENVFLVREGKLLTPPIHADLLAGVTRSALIVLARDLGFEVMERPVARAELVLAEEVFVTGTAAEVTPVREVDGHALLVPGDVTDLLQRSFAAVLSGRDDRYSDWLDVVADRSS